jgi:hypothetical protein
VQSVLLHNLVHGETGWVGQQRQITERAMTRCDAPRKLDDFCASLALDVESLDLDGPTVAARWHANQGHGEYWRVEEEAAAQCRML